MSNQDSAIRSPPNSTAAVKENSVQNVSKSIKLLESALNRLYQTLKKEPHHLEGLALIDKIKKLENNIKELNATITPTKSIKK